MNYQRKSYSIGEKTPIALRQKIKIENLIRKNESLKYSQDIHKKLFHIVAGLYLVTVFLIGIIAVI